MRGLLADTRPLADPHFRRLWLANIVTVVGAQLTVVAVPAQIYEITGSSAYVGLTGLFGLVPLVVFGLYAVQQAFFAVNQPTRSAILPKLVPLDQLPAANSLNMTVFQAGGIAGPLVGGALIPVLGYAWLFLVDTLT